LYYVSHHLLPQTNSPTANVTSLKVIALRSGTGDKSLGNSKVFTVSLPSVPGAVKVDTNVVGENVPSAVGWERNSQGKLASRVADLGLTMDPKRYGYSLRALQGSEPIFIPFLL
jgi:hypothetical protein